MAVAERFSGTEFLGTALEMAEIQAYVNSRLPVMVAAALKTTLIFAYIIGSIPADAPGWGFYAHKKINRLAVFTLPAPMIGFYKANISYIEEASVNPDKRRYAVPDEAARHYLDADYYGDSVFHLLPRKWQDAVNRFGEDTLRGHGVLPWHLETMYFRLREAFLTRDPSRILRVSAELGHYVGDAHVPLHTTENYNGQLTGQDGIHGFWESRLPELFSEEYDFFVGRAQYLQDPAGALWGVVMSTHTLVDKVLREEKELASRFDEKRFAFETRGETTVKVYADTYARAYHRRLEGMVEAQMRASVKMTGDLWFTAWVEAGQPDLQELLQHPPDKARLQEIRDSVEQFKSIRNRIRSHE